LKLGRRGAKKRTLRKILQQGQKGSGASDSVAKQQTTGRRGIKKKKDDPGGPKGDERTGGGE